MSGDVQATRDKVQRYLTELFGSIQVDRDGDFTLRHGSTRVWVGVQDFHADSTAVRVFALANVDVPASPELYQYVATRGSYAFGHLRCSEQDGKVAVYVGHTLLGEFLDPEEFKVALFMVAGIADQVDDEIKTKFGGSRFHEE